MSDTSKTLLAQATALVPRLRQIRDEVLTQHIQREALIDATMLGIASGYPAFFHGTPGVDKTGTIKAMFRQISGATFRDELMPMLKSGADLVVEGTKLKETSTPDGSKFISAESVLGGASKNKVFFGDEIWKSSEGVLKVLFDLFNLNDVRFEGQVTSNELWTVLAASNELCDRDSKLYALWSRMTVRVPVKSLNWTGKRELVQARLVRDRNGKAKSQATVQVTAAEIEQLRSARPHVDVPSSIVDTVIEIIETLFNSNASDFQWLVEDDRRFGRIFTVLQAQALLAGRTTIATQDLTVLKWLLWDTLEQIPTVETTLAPYIRTALSDAQEEVRALMDPTGNVHDVLNNRTRTKGVQATDQCEQALNALNGLLSQATDDPMKQGIGQLIEEVKETKERVIDVMLNRVR